MNFNYIGVVKSGMGGLCLYISHMNMQPQIINRVIIYNDQNIQALCMGNVHPIKYCFCYAEAYIFFYNSRFLLSYLSPFACQF